MVAVLVIGVDCQIAVVVNPVKARVLVLVIGEAVGIVPSSQPPDVEMEVGGQSDPRGVAVTLCVKRIQVVAECILNQDVRILNGLSGDQGLEANHLGSTHLNCIRRWLGLNVYLGAIEVGQIGEGEGGRIVVHVDGQREAPGSKVDTVRTLLHVCRDNRGLELVSGPRLLV